MTSLWTNFSAKCKPCADQYSFQCNTRSGQLECYPSYTGASFNTSCIPVAQDILSMVVCRKNSSRNVFWCSQRDLRLNYSNWIYCNITNTLDDNPNPYFSKGGLIILAVCSVILAVSIILSNLVIVTMFGMSPALRQSCTNFIAINLSVSDILVGMVLIPSWITLSWIEHQASSFNEQPILTWEQLKTLATVFRKVDHGLLVASLFNLTCLSVERAIMIAAPFWYRKHVNKRIIIAFVTTPWIYAVVIVSLSIKSLWVRASIGSRQVFNYTCGIGIPAVIIAISYVVITLSAVQSKRRMQGNSTARVLNARREIKLALKLLSLFLVFLICWLPYFVLHILLALGVDKKLFRENYRILYISKLFSYASSLFDPFIYILARESYRKAIRQFLSSRSRRRIATRAGSKPSMSGPGHTSSL